MGKSKRVVFEDNEDEAEPGAGVGEAEVEPEVEAEAEKEKRKRKRKRVKAPDPTTQDGDAGEAAAASVTSAAAAFSNERTVYIEGLPFEANEAQVREFFKSVTSGNVLSVRLPTWHDSGKLRGYGHVEFSKEAAAKDALKLDGSYLGKRFIKVTTPMVPRVLQKQQQVDTSKIKAPAGCRTIFVKNLPYDSTEDEISEAFKVFGKIQNVRIPVWGHTNQQKGVAYLDFKREDSAEIAVKKGSQTQIRGRFLVVDFETGAPKGSFKGGSSAKK